MYIINIYVVERTFVISKLVRKDKCNDKKTCTIQRFNLTSIYDSRSYLKLE